jgi:hypothetical protein
MHPTAPHGYLKQIRFSVMAGLVPAIHVLLQVQ